MCSDFSFNLRFLKVICVATSGSKCCVAVFGSDSFASALRRRRTVRTGIRERMKIQPPSAKWPGPYGKSGNGKGKVDDDEMLTGPILRFASPARFLHKAMTGDGQASGRSRCRASRVPGLRPHAPAQVRHPRVGPLLRQRNQGGAKSLRRKAPYCGWVYISYVARP